MHTYGVPTTLARRPITVILAAILAAICIRVTLAHVYTPEYYWHVVSGGVRYVWTTVETSIRARVLWLAWAAALCGFIYAIARVARHR